LETVHGEYLRTRESGYDCFLCSSTAQFLNILPFPLIEVSFFDIIIP
jgi:hypothetical protein